MLENENPNVDSTSQLAAEKGEMTDSMSDLENNANLLSKVGDSLKDMFKDEPDYVPEPEQKRELEPKPEPEQKQEPEPEPKPDEEELTEIPYNYVRAAIKNGWTEEAIQKLADTNPEMAMQTMQNIYESTKKLSDQFSQLGRAPQQQATQQPAQQPAQEPVQQGFVDIDKLTQQYGEDPLILNVIKPMNDALVELRNQRVQSTPMPTPVEQTSAELVKEIDMFFGDEHLIKCYGDFYGASNDAKSLTLGQCENRQNVLIRADQIIAGATAQGIEMTIQDALESAHLLTSEPVKTAAIRREIKESAVKHSKGISLRPSSAQPPKGDDSRPRTQKELEQNVAARLANMNW